MRIRTWVLSGVAMAVLGACGGQSDDRQVGTNPLSARSEPAPVAPATPVQTAIEAAPSNAQSGASLESAAALAIGTTLSGEIKAEEQADFYKIDYAAPQRDLVMIKLVNRSTTLRPRLKLYDAAKARIDSKSENTRGANLEISLAMQPGATVYVQVQSSRSVGAYDLAATAQMAFDAFEPNDDILTAKPATVGTPLEAGVLDDKDDDFYRFSGATGKTVRVVLENLSTSLGTSVRFYTATKRQKSDKTQRTRGADLDYELEVEPGQDFYLQVAPYGSSGKYRLSVTNP